MWWDGMCVYLLLLRVFVLYEGHSTGHFNLIISNRRRSLHKWANICNYAALQHLFMKETQCVRRFVFLLFLSWTLFTIECGIFIPFFPLLLNSLSTQFGRCRMTKHVRENKLHSLLEIAEKKIEFFLYDIISIHRDSHMIF